MSDRISLIKELKKIAPVFPIGKTLNEVTEPRIVLTKGIQFASLNSELGGWQNWEVYIYVPSNSIVVLDNLVDKVQRALRRINDIEMTGSINQEFYDDQLNAYMRMIQFRAPQTLY